MSWIEKAKSEAAKASLSEIRDNTVIGLGSGSTVAMIFQRLGEEIRNGKLHIEVVPASSQSELLCIENQVPMTTLNEHPQLDLVIDGADQVVESDLTMIKGGGGALFREKILFSSAQRKVVIVDEEKIVDKLTWPIPIEILPFCYISVMKQIERMGGDPQLRMGVKKNGPIVTDNGNYILEAKFPNVEDYREIEATLKTITGVIETG
ncbi:ribose 5-phosphate isomerase A, partial [[Eubacterium] cellulosolvens]